MDKVENFIKIICCKVHFFDNPMMRNNDSYTDYGMRSNISPPQNPVLTSFENDIYDMVRNIELRKVHNDFQDKLEEATNEIRSSRQVNKSTNLYELSDTDYNRLLSNNITSNYRKCKNDVKHKIDKETKKIADSLDLSKKMEFYASRLTFITTKDHKLNCVKKNKCRLINPVKNDLGLVSKKHLEEIIANIANAIKINQW